MTEGTPTHGGAPIGSTHGIRTWAPRRTVTPKLAEMLADVRRARGWSPREAARRIGCAHGTVAHLEKARRAPSVITAEAIIDAYRLDDRQASMLLAEAVDDAGKSSPYKRAFLGKRGYPPPYMVHGGSRRPL